LARSFSNAVIASNTRPDSPSQDARLLRVVRMSGAVRADHPALAQALDAALDPFVVIP